MAAAEATEPIERWTAKRRVALVVSLLKGETSVVEAARLHRLTVAESEGWREKFLLGAENALRSRPREEEALKDEQIKKLKQKIGDLVLNNDYVTGGLETLHFGPDDIRRVSGTLSDVSQRRSCQVLGSAVRACIGRQGTSCDALWRLRRGPSGCGN